MTDLSPASEAVLNAVTLKRYDVPYYACPGSIDQIKADVAAALEAAADQVVPKEIEPANAFEEEGYVPGRLREQRQETRRKLIAIAAELRGTTTTTETQQQ
jgi:hypothetical protein